MYDSAIPNQSDVTDLFLKRTDKISIDSEKLHDISGKDVKDKHPYKDRNTRIFDMGDSIEFAKRCNSCKELRYLCTKGADRVIYDKFLKLKDDETFWPVLYKAAFEPFNFLIPTMASEDVLGIVGVAVHYNLDDQGFPLYTKSKTTHFSEIQSQESVVDYIFTRVASAVRKHAEEHEEDVLKIRTEGMWEGYDPKKIYVPRANELQI